MALYKMQVVLKTDDGIAANYATNSLYADIVVETLTTATDIVVAIAASYNAVSTVLSSLLDTTGHEVKFYKLSDPSPRAPTWTLPFGITGLGSSAGPTEVSAVVSFQAVKVSGLPQARRRGRIYLGPLINSLADATGRIDATDLAYIANWGDLLLIASTANADWTWAVYSPTDGTGVDVDNGWADNEFDTQRRRGRPATLRSTF